MSPLTFVETCTALLRIPAFADIEIQGWSAVRVNDCAREEFTFIVTLWADETVPPICAEKDRDEGEAVILKVLASAAVPSPNMPTLNISAIVRVAQFLI